MLYSMYYTVCMCITICICTVLSCHRVKCGIILRILLSVYYFIRLMKSQIKINYISILLHN